MKYKIEVEAQTLYFELPEACTEDFWERYHAQQCLLTNLIYKTEKVENDESGKSSDPS
jgi:hypothetical protein